MATIALVPDAVHAEPRFRCIACNRVHSISALDRHANAGGRIGESCVQSLERRVVDLIDRFGLDAASATEALAVWGIGARAHLDRLVERLGGSPGRPASVPWLIEHKHQMVRQTMETGPGCAPGFVRRSGHLEANGATMTKAEYDALSDADHRVRLAREYGSIAR